jgi:hypothetical protein
MTLPHSMLAGVAKLMALQYAQTLYVGATVDETDLRYCEPFVHELPAALEAHGLRLVNGIVERTEKENAA